MPCLHPGPARTNRPSRSRPAPGRETGPGSGRGIQAPDLPPSIRRADSTPARASPSGAIMQPSEPDGRRTAHRPALALSPPLPPSPSLSGAVPATVFWRGVSVATCCIWCGLLRRAGGGLQAACPSTGPLAQASCEGARDAACPPTMAALSAGATAGTHWQPPARRAAAVPPAEVAAREHPAAAGRCARRAR